MAFLRVSSLDVRPRWWHAQACRSLDNIELMLDEGSLCTVFGAEGSGKATLLRTLAGLHRPARGQIVLDGEDITRRPLGRRRTALVPAQPVVYPALTVRENLAFPLVCQGVPPEQIGHQVSNIASLLGLLDCLSLRAGGLTPSTAQRVAIGRALVREDLGLLLLDNAFSVLEPESRTRVVGALRQVQRMRRMCTLVSTLDQADVMGLGDQWVMLDEGRIAQQGRAAEFQQYPRTLAVARRLFGNSLNVLPCRPVNGQARFAGQELLPPLPPQLDIWLAELQAQYPKGYIELAIRPENIILGRTGLEGCIETTLTGIEDDGTWMRLQVVLAESGLPLVAHVKVDTPQAYDLVALPAAQVIGRPLLLQIINRHSLFFLDGRLVQ
ncbi:MAG: ABC transporter ATP-binding protein [Lautropia sp.]|nr:ABC transporter ATP-binding protein [Lautropia sp.]